MRARKEERLARYAASVALLAFSACSLKPSVKTPGPEAAAESNSPGFRYYLPIDQIEIEASRTSTTTYRPKSDLSQREMVGTKDERTIEVDVHTVADPSVSYSVALVPGRWSDDTLKVKLNSNGTLASVNAESTGRVSDVIKNVVRFATTVSTLAGGGLGAAASAPQWPSLSICFAGPNLPDVVRDRYFVAAPPPSSSWMLDKSTLPSRELQLLLLGAREACESWQLVKTDEQRVEQRRVDVRELEDRLAQTPPAQKPALQEQLRTARVLLERAQAELRSREALFAAIRTTKLKTWGLAPKVDKQPPLVVWVRVDQLPSTRLVAEDPSASAVGPKLMARDLKASKNLLDKVGLLVTHAPIAAPTTSPDPKKDTCSKVPEEDTGRFYYRQVVPTILTTWEKNAAGTLVVKDYTIEPLIARAPTRCVEFSASGFSVRKLAMTFDNKGRPVTLERSSTSSAAGFTGALATAATTARDTYVDTLGKLVTADTAQRTLALSELESELEKLKTQKEILDADIALHGSEANRDLLLQRQALDAQLQLVQADLTLQQTTAGTELQLTIAQLKLQLEQLQQQVAILQAEAQLRSLEED